MTRFMERKTSITYIQLENQTQIIKDCKELCMYNFYIFRFIERTISDRLRIRRDKTVREAGFLR